MRYAYSVEATRRLEATAMAALGESGDDALMQRAAHGLSVRVAAELLDCGAGCTGGTC